MAAKLFERTQIRSLPMANRFVRSATYDSLADREGAVTPALIDFHALLARGGVGLILPGYAYVLKDGRAHVGQLGAHDDAMLRGLTDLAQAVHEAGGRVALQIVHCGAHSDAADTGEQPMGPCAISTADGPICRAMTREDIDRVVQGFGDAAARAQRAGFDAVQIHAAHGYLLSQFMSPFYNRRTDAYGGSALNRGRIVFEVYDRVRQAVGREYPVLIKLNCTDFLDDGLQLSDVVLTAKRLEEDGIDAIELSGGTIWGHRVLGDVNKMAFRIVQEEAYYCDAASLLQREVETPIILTGGIRSYEVARDLVETGVADYIGLCRPLIREPDLVMRWERGDLHKSACVSDNACFRPIREGKGPLRARDTRIAAAREDRGPCGEQERAASGRPRLHMPWSRPPAPPTRHALHKRSGTLPNAAPIVDSLIVQEARSSSAAPACRAPPTRRSWWSASSCSPTSRPSI